MQLPPPRQPIDRQRLLLMLMLMQAQQGAQTQTQGPSKLDQLVDALKKGKQTYDDGKKLYDLGNAGVNYFSGPSYTPATQAAWNQAAGEASQQAWNAGADAATAQAGGDTVAGQASSTMSKAAPWIAVAMSAMRSGKALTDKNTSDEDKAYEGSMAIPRAVGAYYTLGLSNLAEGIARDKWGGTMKKLDKFNKNNPMSPVFAPMMASRLWTSDKWKTEGNRLKGLQEKGINIPEFLQGAMKQTRGRKKEELINPYLPKDFVGNTPQYGWVNNKFANSRNESDLTGRDIWGYSAFFDKYGNDWLGKFSEKQREDIANRALQRGAVKEHHGTIDINWNPELENDVNAITGGSMIPKAQPSKPQQNQPQTPQPVQATNNNRKGILGRIR